MKRSSLEKRLHLSTIGSDSYEAAKQYGLGIEVAEFCTAMNLDSGRDDILADIQRKIKGVEKKWFHDPFSELCPAAIDPKVRALSKERYLEGIEAARVLGIHNIVIHSGYIPLVYFPVWFVEQSVLFWKDFLKDAPKDITIGLENVMEGEPSMLVDIARQVDDPRFGLTLDIGHANCVVSELPPMDWIPSMAPYLKHIHIHNNLGKDDLHSPLGEGTIPMEEILDTLLETCPDVTFTIENMFCNPSLLWLREHGYLTQDIQKIEPKEDVYNEGN